MSERPVPAVAAAAEADAVAVVTALLAGEPGTVRTVVADTAGPRRMLLGFLLAERAVAACAGRAREAGDGDGGRAVFAAALQTRHELGAAAALGALAGGPQVAAARAEAVQVVLALVSGAAGRVRDLLRRRLGPAAPEEVALVFCACLAELTAAVVSTVSAARGEPAQAYLQRWGLELATDPATRGGRVPGVE